MPCWRVRVRKKGAGDNCGATSAAVIGTRKNAHGTALSGPDVDVGTVQSLLE